MKKLTSIQIAEKCLNSYWGSGSCRQDYSTGWDRGSEAHKTSIKWAKKNIRRFCQMTFKKIYAEYLVFLRQE